MLVDCLRSSFECITGALHSPDGEKTLLLVVAVELDSDAMRMSARNLNGRVSLSAIAT